jgi:hypothetical protein
MEFSEQGWKSDDPGKTDWLTRMSQLSSSTDNCPRYSYLVAAVLSVNGIQGIVGGITPD